MGVGKYSPTVTDCYRKDQEWHRKNTTDPEAWYDDDGYDSYGYNVLDVDRAGVHENDYICGEWINPGTRYEQYVYEKYDSVAEEWTSGIVDGKLKPVPR